MLKFSILTEQSRKELTENLLSALPDSDAEYLEEIIESLSSPCGFEYALSCADGCLLIRVFDNGYSFIYPVAVCDGADEAAAVLKIRAYAVKEEIPLVFTDVPSEELGRFLPLFRHANVDASDPEGENYTVRVLSEIDALDEIPTLEIAVGLTLDAIKPSDDGDYARLCKDFETNRFWGYDYKADEADPEDSYFRKTAEREFARGVAMSFAIRINGKFAGEVSLYRFDLLGGCDCAVRILPEFRRGGVAGSALSSIIDYARETGLIKIRASVMADNLPSIKMCKKYFESYSETDGTTVDFITEL